MQYRQKCLDPHLQEEMCFNVGMCIGLCLVPYVMLVLFYLRYKLTVNLMYEVQNKGLCTKLSSNKLFNIPTECVITMCTVYYQIMRQNIISIFFNLNKSIIQPKIRLL